MSDSVPMSLLETVALSIVPGLNPITRQGLYTYTCEELLKGGSLLKTLRNYQELPGRPTFSTEALLEKAAGIIAYCEQNGIQLLTRQDYRFPQLMCEGQGMNDAPILLYVKGDDTILNQPSLSVVGTRKGTNYGKAHCMQMVSGAVKAGLVIVSGLAYGIDLCAHEACLDSGGKTVAILAHGLDEVFPRGNIPIADRIVQAGCLLSEYPPGIKPTKYTFPQRNRLIAGLSTATLVVESAERGGSMITAKLADDYNRVVLAIAGNLNSPLSMGCNLLISKQKAHLVINSNQLLEHYQFQQQGLFKVDSSNPVLAAIRKLGTATTDQLLAITGRGHGYISMQLIDLQVEGEIVELPGKLYAAKDV